ncbi:unnamed protein product [Fraxinus pennsylvanica]|uniref:Uncharacterized protein n=1 Tax=Fraxinus pennsylvanica TaxID=56036 RepID=A0AAD2DQF7_9LAMI|nr:unnamed protein product [Fraxinus pennsylvanica]
MHSQIRCPRSNSMESILKRGETLMVTHWRNVSINFLYPMLLVCLGECDEIRYKDPVLKDRQWSAYIDHSPVVASYSEECFHACVAGYGYKFDLPSEKVNQVHSKRPSKHPTVEKPPAPPAVESRPPRQSGPADCHLAFLHS